MMISLSLLQRTIVGIALLVGLLLLSIATGSLGLTRLQGMTRQLAEVEAAKVDHASQAALLLGQVDRQLTQLLNREDASAYAGFIQAQPARRQAISQHFAELERLTDDQEGRVLLADVLSRRQQVLATLTQLTPLLDAGQFAEGRRQFDRTGLPAFRAYLAAVDRYLALQKRRLAEHSQRANDTVAAFRLWLTLIGAASLLAALLIAVWLVRSVSRPLGGDPRVAGEAFNRIAQGDLASQVSASHAHPHSVLARLSGMRSSLRSLVGNISGGHWRCIASCP
jgi:nitrogen fixation/metabolism regulation signal transduction histidine kinase